MDYVPSPKIGVSSLKSIAILYPEDLYELALWLLKTDIARSTVTSKHRHTLWGVVQKYKVLTRLDTGEVCKHLEKQGFSLSATVEHDEDVAG